MVLLLAASAPACPSVPNGPLCDVACGNLSSCGLLPSPLGASTDDANARDNCEARCGLSDDVVGDKVRDCASALEHVSNDWCKSGSECERIAACLESAYPEATILGEAAVAVNAVDGPGTPLVCGDGFGLVRTTPIDDPRDWCQRERITTGLAFVLDRSGYHPGAETACEQLIAQQVTFRHVEPGLLTPGFELRGTQPSEEDGGTPEPFCRVHYGPTNALSAGILAVAPVFVQQGAYDCENTPDMCQNGKDDDRNGLADCHDPKCDCENTVEQGDAGLDAGSIDDADCDQENADVG
jgi:hypothetical protein